MSYITYLGTKNKKIFKHEQILYAVCLVSKINEKVIFKKCRKIELVDARCCFNFLCRKYTNLSLKQIGFIQNRDYATIINSLKHSHYKEVQELIALTEIELSKY